MKEQKKDWFELLSLILGILLLCVILVITISSLKITGQCYTDLKGADLSQEIESVLYYDDHMFCQIGFGINIIPDEPGNEARRSSFLASSVQAIDIRILACGLLYSMMVGAVLQYFIYSRYHSEIKKHFLGIVMASIAPFAVFAAAVLISQSAFGLPAVFLEGHEWFLITVCLLSIAAGSCILGAVLSVVRCKKLTAALAVPAVLFLFIVSMNLEWHLYTSPTVDSFDSFYEAHEDALADDFDGEFYYDDGKNAIILDGVEYPPETVDNPAYYTGWKRVCTFLFELVDAYSGNGLLLTETIMDDIPLPLWAIAAYIIKAAMWIVIASCLMKRRRIPDRIN